MTEAKSKEETILMRIDKRVTQRSLAIATLLIAIVIVFNPLLLPLTVSYPTQGFISRIDAVPEGSTVMFVMGIGQLSFYNNYRTGIAQVLDYLYSKHLKIIFFPRVEEDIVSLEDVFAYLSPKKYGYIYGKDYVILNIVPGGEIGLAAIAENLMFNPLDAYKSALADMPVMKGMRKLTDFPLLVIAYIGFDTGPQYIRQWAYKFKVPIITVAQWGILAEYYGTYIFGNLDWIQGLAEFQYATRRPAEEIINLDARNVLIFFIFGGIILGSIARWQESRLGKRGVPT